MQIFFCLGDAYKVAKQYEQIEQIVGEGETSSSSDEYLSALTRVKFGLKDEGFQGRGRGSVRGRVSYDRGHSRDSYSDERRKERLTCGGRHRVTECYQKCGSCGKPGHPAVNCWDNRSYEKRDTRHENIQCYFCKEYGHIRAHCERANTRRSATPGNE